MELTIKRNISNNMDEAQKHYADKNLVEEGNNVKM
jgi:hypothetical protein